MTQNKKHVTSAGIAADGSGPKSSFFRLVGATLLAACLIAGIVSATDAGSPPHGIQKAMNYINSNLVESGDTATLVNVTEESGVYRIGLTLTGTQKTGFVYATEDGHYLFPSYYDMTRPPAAGTKKGSPAMTPTPTKAWDAIRKQDTPDLQAFVVSYCPFGVQMQGILADIVSQVPALNKNIKVRYIGEISNGTIQSMHGPKESEENLRQICIRDEQGEQYWDYVSCFIATGTNDTCAQSSGIDTGKLAGCIRDPGRGMRYAGEDVALTRAYGIHGSPTIVLNNETVSEFDFGGRTPDVVRNMLCAGFANQPADCSIAVNATRAAAGSSGHC